MYGLRFTIESISPYFKFRKDKSWYGHHTVGVVGYSNNAEIGPIHKQLALHKVRSKI